MGYSTDPEMVRVDFFKQSGKWYCTEAVRFYQYNESDIMYAFARALQEHMGGDTERLSDMDAVCLHPYHKHAYPLMMKHGEWNNYTKPWGDK
jgi:hypothetical protein